MSRLPRLARLVIPVLVLCLLGSQPGTGAAQSGGEVWLGSLDDDGVQAVVSLGMLDGQVTLTVHATGLDPGATCTVWTHAGTCEAPSASFGVVGAMSSTHRGAPA